jgi:hypothetical protein
MILRWVQHYTPDFEKRWNRYARSVGGFRRCHETYIIKVKALGCICTEPWTRLARPWISNQSSWLTNPVT